MSRSNVLDPVVEARQLIESARQWVRCYARVVADDVPAADLDPIIRSVGEVGFSDACDAVDRVAQASRARASHL